MEKEERVKYREDDELKDKLSRPSGVNGQRPQTEPNYAVQSPPPQYPFHPPQQPPFPAQVGDFKEVPPARVVPPSGNRIPLGQNVQFPAPDQLGQPLVIDLDSLIPSFIGSAIFPNSVHPCRIVPSLNPPCRVLFGGGEIEHHGRYDLLLVTQDMECVPTENGEIPPGRRPVEGGYESNGNKLYHALVSFGEYSSPGRLVCISGARFYRLKRATTTDRRTTVSCAGKKTGRPVYTNWKN